MKPLLPPSLLVLLSFSVLASVSSAQQYNGNQIANYNGIYPADDFQISFNQNSTADSGAIRHDQYGTAGATTTLQGNISISSGEDYAADTANNRPNHGIWLEYRAKANCSVILETVNADDSIVINTYGKGGHGIYNALQTGTVVLDATKSDNKTITINSNCTTGEGMGIFSLGAVTVNGDLDITSGSYGVYANLATGDVTINGNANIKSVGDYSSGGIFANGGSITIDTTNSDNKTVEISCKQGRGVSADGTNSTILITGNLTATVDGTPGSGSEAGIHASSDNSSITVTGDTLIDSTGHGVYVLTNGTVNLQGESNQITAGSSGICIRSTGAFSASGTIDIESESHGIYLYSSTKKTELANDITITTNGERGRGIYAANSSGGIDLSGNVTIHTNGTEAAYAIQAATTEGNTSSVVGRGQYIITGEGGIVTSGGGSSLVDLEMTGDSSFTGYTSKQTGTLNLSLEDTSTWTLTKDSVLSNLDVYESSAVVFTITDQNDFTDITTAAVMMQTNSIVTVKLSGYNPIENDSFRLIIAETYDIAGLDGILYQLDALDPNLYWDTSEFASNGTLWVRANLNVPEPSTACLVLAAGALFSLKRRKRPTA